MKKCTTCKIEKNDEDFGKIKTVKSGLKSRCKECTKIYRNKYKLENKEKFKQQCKKQSQKHYKQNKDKILENNEIWRQKNQKKYEDYQRKYQKKYYIENKDYINERSKKYSSSEAGKFKAREYKKRNPEKIKARTLLRYAISIEYIIRPTECSRCLKECKPEGHHPDYSKPLEVVWLCIACHNKEHGK